jgi:hypothetical protein
MLSTYHIPIFTISFLPLVLSHLFMYITNRFSSSKCKFLLGILNSCLTDRVFHISMVLSHCFSMTSTCVCLQRTQKWRLSGLLSLPLYESLGVDFGPNTHTHLQPWWGPRQHRYCDGHIIIGSPYHSDVLLFGSGLWNPAWQATAHQGGYVPVLIGGGV